MEREEKNLHKHSVPVYICMMYGVKWLFASTHKRHTDNLPKHRNVTQTRVFSSRSNGTYITFESFAIVFDQFLALIPLALLYLTLSGRFSWYLQSISLTRAVLHSYISTWAFFYLVIFSYCLT